jgi:hypothetical protein
VVIERAWKKEIYEGSNPVGPGGIVTLTGAIVPTLATVSSLLDSIRGLSSKIGASEKTNPTFPFMAAKRVDN